MSKKQSSTPHDALFKLFLRQPETARDFLAFHLPAPIHALCDMKTLKQTDRISHDALSYCRNAKSP